MKKLDKLGKRRDELEPAEKPVSLKPLKPAQALGGLLKVKPPVRRRKTKSPDDEI